VLSTCDSQHHWCSLHAAAGPCSSQAGQRHIIITWAAALTCTQERVASIICLPYAVTDALMARQGILPTVAPTDSGNP